MRARAIGPIGTASRVVGGLIAITLPIALGGFGWWDAAAAFIALPLIAAAAAVLVGVAYRRRDQEVPQPDQAICSPPACALAGLVVAAYLGLTFATPLNGSVALWVWLGASMLIAAVRGYGGCEVLAIPNLLTGRDDRIGCMIYTPIDRAEARRQAHRERIAGEARPAR